MLTGHKVPQHKANNVTAVLQFSKLYFAWHNQQSAAATTTYFVSRSLYCIHHVSHWKSNSVTTPSSCILLPLASVCNQSLTCTTPSSLSFCRISFIPGKLNPPSGYAMKFLHLFGMVTPIACTTQQNFLFCPFAESDTFHWSRHFL